MRSKPLGITVKGIVGLMLLVAIGSGCATTKDYVNLDYVPQQGVLKDDGAENVAIAVNVSDVRSTTDKVSRKKNGKGSEAAAIISNNDVASLVNIAISDELHNRGFKVSGGPVVVDIELIKFYNDFRTELELLWSLGNADAEVIFNVQVKKPDGNISYAKTIVGLYTKEGIMLASGENAEIALEGALRDAVSKLMEDESFTTAIRQAGSSNAHQGMSATVGRTGPSSFQ